MRAGDYLRARRLEALADGEGGVVSERERHELEGSGSYLPDAVPVDLEAQRRELEEAGWKRLERLGKVVWRGYTAGEGGRRERVLRIRGTGMKRPSAESVSI
jgi:hypothetical protein